MTGPRGLYQDCLLEPVRVGNCWIVAVADGLGGSNGGEIASSLAIDEVRKKLKSPGQMDEVFEAARAKIQARSHSDADLAKMGTTLTCLLIEGITAEVGHVGDTRITHIRGGGVMSRTEDQTEVQRLLDNGVITHGQAKRHPRRNVIYSALSGREDKYTLFQNQFETKIGDRIILSSDGFHTLLLRKELAQISQSSRSLDEFSEGVQIALKQKVLTDDATAIFIEVTG